LDGHFIARKGEKKILIDVSDILDRLAKLPLEIERVGSICGMSLIQNAEVAGLVCQGSGARKRMTAP